MRKRILVTGANGLIGANLVKILSKDINNYIYALDKVRIKNITPKKNIEILHYRDLKVPISLPDVDVIYHLAAYNGTKHFYNVPYDVIQDNILSTINVINEYKQHKQKPLLIYTGTPESRTSITLPTNENAPYFIDDPFNPRWSYANSKALGEQAVIHNGVLPYIIVIPYNIYGPNQKDHFIPEFINRVKNGKYEVYGANNTRTFLYVDDCSDALIKLWKTQAAYNNIFNIGGEIEIPIIEVAKLILRLMNIDKNITEHVAPTGSTLRRCPNILKIIDTIDWIPTTNIVQGLKKVLEYTKWN